MTFSRILTPSINVTTYFDLLTAVCFRQAADTGGPGTVLLHQPGMSDGRQHGRQRGDADRRCTTNFRPFLIFCLCVSHLSYIYSTRSVF